jgi:hypothetical protein
MDSVESDDSGPAEPPSPGTETTHVGRPGDVGADDGSPAALAKRAVGSAAEALRRPTGRHNVLAIIALGLVAVSPLTVGALAPVGAILGHLSLRQLKSRPQTGRGMARAAVIIGWTLTFTAPCLALGALIVTGGSVIHLVTEIAGYLG